MGRVSVHVAPGAPHRRLVGRHGDGWKAHVAAPAARGRANAALVDLLAHALDVPRARVSIVAGHTARRKVVEVESLEAPEIERRLASA